MSLYDKSKDTMLIELVRQRPVLYSSFHPQHRNYIEKHRAWEEISAILETPIPGLKQRWKHFRDHYHKKKKQTPKKSEWKYMTSLRFLSHKTDAPLENKTEKIDMKPKLSTLSRNYSSDFSSISEFENDGSESASSIGSLGCLSKDMTNQTENEREKPYTLLRDRILKSFKLPGDTPSSSKQSPSRSRSVEMSSRITTNRNDNDNENESITIEPTSEPSVSESQSETSKKWLETMEAFGKSQKESSISQVHQFFEAVADVVSLLPPHLISEAKFAIHKNIYRIERECLGLDDDEDL